jgi:uncharacterized protein (TIGR03067 family)
MVCSALVGLVSALLGAHLTDAGDLREPRRTALDPLHGAWEVVDAPKFGPIRLIFDGDRLTVVFTETHKVEHRIKIDPRTRPARIDALHGDETVTAPGIYEVRGDTLRICVAAWLAERPTEFAAKKGVILLNLTRQRRGDREQDMLLRALLEAGVSTDDPALATALKFVHRSSIPVEATADEQPRPVRPVELAPAAAKQALLEMMRSRPGKALGFFDGALVDDMAKLDVQMKQDGWYHWTGAYRFHPGKATYLLFVPFNDRPQLRPPNGPLIHVRVFEGSFEMRDGRWTATVPRYKYAFLD